MSITAIVLIHIQAVAAFGYAAVAVFAWTRRDGPAWWAFRFMITSQVIRAISDGLGIYVHRDVFTQLEWWSLFHMVGAVLGAISTWALAVILSRNLGAKVGRISDHRSQTAKEG